MLEFEYEEDRLEAFKEASTITKDALLRDLKWKIHELESGREVDEFKNHSAAFRNLYISLIKRFREKIEKTILFDELEPWWSYEYEVNDSGATLHLQYADSVDFRDDGSIDFMVVGQEFDLVKVSTRLLTVEEYASIYEVSVGTVRQWIRRGKLRSAIKAGSEWRIPELSEITGRGYRRATFHWNDKLSDVPEEYSYLKEYSWLSIDQNVKNKNLFRVVCRGKDTKSLEMIMETKEREKFELYLISNPLIKATEELFGSFA